MTTPLTRIFGKLISQLRRERVPTAAVSVIHMGFTDCVGAMIAGRNEPPPQKLKAALAPAPGEAIVLFGEETASAPEAAWINGTAAHALDYDDVALRGHPSTVLVPAILAEAEALGATGRQMVAAYAAGYEIWAELVSREVDHHHVKGWHPTGIFGAIAASAACASLRGLDAQQSAHAIGLGASQSAGLVANFGSMAKPFHAGHAAHAGVMAARLAAHGFTASLDALEHPLGFLAAVSPAGRFDVESPLEESWKWRILNSRLSIKKYPTCYATHRALDGMLDLLKATPIDVSSVRRVNVSLSRRNIEVLRNHSPQTGLEAKFSMEFAMASALIAGRATLVELCDEFVRRADVQEMMRRVTLEPDDRLDPNPNADGYAIHDLVTVETEDGRRVMGEKVNQVRGGADKPLSRDDLWTKFESCLRIGALPAPARPLFDSLMSLEDCGNARQLYRHRAQ